MMNEVFWNRVAGLWTVPVDPLEIAKQKEFLEGLPSNFGYIDKKLMSDNLDDLDDIDDW